METRQDKTDAKDRMYPRAFLEGDHARLERLFLDLLAAFHAGDREGVARLWTEFDQGLSSHLQAEEAWVLPKFREVNEAEARALLADHDKIRRRLAELGVAVDLHLIHEDMARQFIDDLRKHAAREDALLYKWADQEAPPEAQKGVVEHVKRWSRPPGA